MGSIDVTKKSVQLDSSLTAADKRRRELTADLYLRRDPFWRAIKCVRHSFIVFPTTEVPSSESLTNLSWYPRLPVPAPGTLPFLDDGTSTLPPYSSEWYAEIANAFLFSWQWTLVTLAVEFAEPDSRDGLSSSSDWHSFLVQCIYHDPPPEQLLQFSDLSSSSPGEQGESITPRVYLGHDVVRFVDHVASSVLSDVASRLSAAGVAFDLETELDRVRSVARTNLAFFESVHGRTAIQVNSTTTERQVLNAFRTIHATHPGRTQQKQGRPSRDTLRCLQAAVWADDFDLTEAQIGQRMGLNLTLDEWGYARRCQAARGYIAEGRDLRGRY